MGISYSCVEILGGYIGFFIYSIMAGAIGAIIMELWVERVKERNKK